MITSREGLNIAYLIFYIPVLFWAAYVAHRHGFSKQAGWFFLLLLALVRIIGPIMELVSVNSPSVGLIEGYIILASVGLSPLLLAMLGLLKRLNEGMANGPLIPSKVFSLLIILPVAGLVLAIIGGTDQAPGNTPSTVSTGLTLVRAAIIVFVVIFIFLCIITAVILFSIRSISKGEAPLLYAVALSIPFLLVRLIYALLVDFDTGSTTFSYTNGSVVVQAFMATLEEFIVVLLYLTAGLLAPKIARSNVQTGVPLAERDAPYSAGSQHGILNPGVEGQPQQGQKQAYYQNSGKNFEQGSRRTGRRRQGPIGMLISQLRSA